VGTRRIGTVLINILFIVLLGCKPEQDKLSGQWLNLNNSSQTDLILWNIEADKVSTVNGNNDLRIRRSERAKDQLIIERADGINERFLFEFKGVDTLVLRGDLNNEYFLVKLESVVKCDECSARIKYDSLKETLVGKTWESRVSLQNDLNGEPERRSLLEFKEKNKVLFYSYADGEYKYSNVLEWSLVYQNDTVVLVLRGVMNNYLFLNSISPGEIQGLTFSTGKWNPEGVESLNKVRLTEYMLDQAEESIDILGNWKAVAKADFRVPDELYIYERKGNINIDFLFKDTVKNSTHVLDLNLFQDMILIDDLANGRADHLEILEYKDGQITLKWGLSREPVVFKKYNSDYFID